MPITRDSLTIVIAVTLSTLGLTMLAVAPQSWAVPAQGADGARGLPDSSGVTQSVMTSDKSGNATVQLEPSDEASKVLNGFVVPHWIGTSDRFWYRRELKDKRSEFRTVDAASGASRTSFDAQVIAAGLAKVGVADAKADSLPFTNFDFSKDGKAITFDIASVHYECLLAKPSCRSVQPVSPALSVSPDGRHAILVKDGDLWLRDVNAGTEKALSSGGSHDNGFGVYPDGWKAAYIPRAKSSVPLPPLGASWSPDSSRVLISHTDQRNVAPYPYVEYAPDDGSFRPKAYNIRIPLTGEAPAKFEWYIAGVADGTLRRIEFPYDQLLDLQQDLLAIRKTWWSSDGKALFAVAFGSNMAAAYLFKVDATTGAVKTVITERDSPRADLNSTSYNPPNVRVVDDGREIIWWSQRDGWGHLYLYDGENGRLKTQITHGNWLVRDIIAVDARRKRIYFTASGREPGDPYFRYLYRVDFNGRGLTLLTPEPMDHVITGPGNDVVTLDGAISYDVVSPSFKYVVYNQSTLDKPTESVIRTTDGRRIATFERADVTALLAGGYHPPKPVKLTAADGTTPIWGALYLPAGLDEHKHYPVIDAQYGSPLTAVVPHNYMTALKVPCWPQPATLEHEGFASIVLDARGTTYRSKSFSNAMFGKLDTMNLEDHVAGIKELARTYPWLDIERVGVIGASYGGWVTFRAMLRFGEFYKVGVAMVPPGGMQSMYLDYHWNAFQGEPVYANGSHLRPGPTDFPINWKGLDSSVEANRLNGKLLIVMGLLDENAVPGSTMQFINALMKANKDFDLVVEPQANHYATPNPYTAGRAIAFLKAGLGSPN